MDNAILMRALWALAIACGGIAIYWLVNRVILARARGKRLGLETIHLGGC